MSVSPEDGENTVSPVDAPAPDSATAPDAEQLAALFDTSPEAGLLAVLEAVRGRNPEMARSLRAILADPARAADMGAAGRQRVLAEFDIAQEAGKLAALFREGQNE